MSNQAFNLENVRVKYAGVDAPNEKGKYELSVLIPKDNQTLVNRIRAAAAESAKSMGVPASPKNIGLNDGDDNSNEAMHGHWYINMRTKFPVAVVGRNLAPVPAGTVKSGSWVNVAVGGCYVASFEGQKKMGWNLGAVQFLKDDAPVSGGPNIDPSIQFEKLDSDGGVDDFFEFADNLKE